MPKLTEELKATQSRIEAAVAERDGKIKARDEFRGKIEAAEGPFDKSSDLFKSAKQATAEAGRLGDEISDLRETEANILGLLGRADEAAHIQDRLDGNGPQDGRRAATLQRGISEATERMLAEHGGTLERYAASTAQTGRTRLGELASREQAADLLRTPEAATLLSSDVQPIIPADRRTPRGAAPIRTRFLDLLPIGQTNSNLVETVIEVPTAITADTVVENTRKPEENFSLTAGGFPVRTVAAWVKIAKQALEDGPRVQGLLERRLPQKLRKRLEVQAIAGTGVAPQLKGILNSTGIGIQTQVTGQPDVETILDAITLVILSDYDPNVVGLAPQRWAGIRKMRESAGAGQYLFGSPAVAGDTTVWGIPAIAAASIAANRALVGDTDGAELTVRSGIQVLVSDSDGEDFTYNRVTFLAEGRFALPVEQPGAFARVEFI